MPMNSYDSIPERAQSREAGFTLVEIVATLIILGLLAAVAVPKFIELDEHASKRAIDAGIAELNSRETLTWTVIKTTSGGWQSDADVFLANDYDLGNDYYWLSGPDAGGGSAEGGGTLGFHQGFSVELGRTDSTVQSPAHWYRR